MQKNVRVKLYDIVIFLLYFSVVKVYAVPQVIQQILKIISMGIVASYFLSHSTKSFFNKTIILPCLMLISSVVYFIGGSSNIKILLDGILNASCYCLISACVCYTMKKNMQDHLVEMYYYLTLICCGISIISVFVKAKSANNYGAEVIYVFGNKYATCYLFIFLIGLAYYKFYDFKKKKLKKSILILCFIILALLISYVTRCYTTLVAFGVMLILFFFSERTIKKIRKFINNPIVAVLLVAVPGMVAMNITAVMQNPFVYKIVTEWFGKTAGLTGRAYIYSNLYNIYARHPFIGYGYNSDIVNIVTEVGNAQNGIMQSLIDYGAIGTIALLAIVYLAFKNSNKKDRYWGFKISFLTFCVCSIVEIPFKYLFFFVVSFLFFSNRDEALINIGENLNEQ